jgi:PEP-CTERM motif-containing protein
VPSALTALHRKFPASLLVALFALAAVPVDVGATPLTFAFTGTVSSLEGIAPAVLPTVSIGSAISGTYTFESAAIDSDPLPTSGIYTSLGPPYGIVMQLGGQLFSASNSQILVRTLICSGCFNYSAVWNNPLQGGFQGPPGIDIGEIGVFVYGPGIVTSDSLPLAPPLLSTAAHPGFPEIQLIFSDIAGSVGIVNGSLSSLTAVPEPSTLSLLLLSGVFVKVLVAKRRASWW